MGCNFNLTMWLAVGPLLLWLVSSAAARHLYNNPFPPVLQARQVATGSSNASLQVDLGYAAYEGYTNSTTGLNTWLGVRFAAPPIGANRWQKPQPPVDQAQYHSQPKPA